MIEGFYENRNYGTCTNKNTNYTVISNLSASQPFLGHFTYAVSEYLKSNYISSEKVSGSQFIPKYKINLSRNQLYFEDDIENEFLEAKTQVKKIATFRLNEIMNSRYSSILD